MDYYRTPLLTARETARYLGMPESTLDVWLRRPENGSAPLVHAVTPEQRGWPRVPFVGIIEAYVLRGLRDLKVPMPEIRAAAGLVRESFGDPYALATRRVATDGVTVFARLADGWVRAKDLQRPIEKVLEQHLRQIDWASNGTAQRLHLQRFAGADVIIDPRFGWGSPVLADSKVRVDDIFQLWKAGETIAAVAEEYELPVAVVEDVVRQAA